MRRRSFFARNTPATAALVLLAGVLLVAAGCSELPPRNPAGPGDDPRETPRDDPRRDPVIPGPGAPPASLRAVISPGSVVGDVIDEASLTITALEAVLLAESARTAADTTAPDSGSITLLDSSLTLNLLDLGDGLSTLIENLDVPAGTYSSLRLFVGGAEVKLTDGRRMDADVPSGAQSGLKLRLKTPLQLGPGDSGAVMIDVDVNRSFVMKGNPGNASGIKGFSFKPVVRAANLGGAGHVTGTVTDLDETPLRRALVWLEQADSMITTTASHRNGYFALHGIPPGRYELYATAAGYDTASWPNLEVQRLSTRSFSLLLQEAPSDSSGPSNPGNPPDTPPGQTL